MNKKGFSGEENMRAQYPAKMEVRAMGFYLSPAKKSNRIPAFYVSWQGKSRWFDERN